MKRELTCISCPLGCQLTVEFENNEITNITGFTCPRGKEYAKNECTNPVRIVTSTVRTADGSFVPVKTDKPVPKNKIFECMRIINSTEIKTPVSVGDVLIPDVFGSNIVATANKE